MNVHKRGKNSTPINKGLAATELAFPLLRLVHRFHMTTSSVKISVTEPQKFGMFSKP
jgi:hypothetical protein